MDCGFDAHPATTGFSRFAPITLPPEPIDRRRALQAIRLERISRHVEANLDDPNLTAQSAARALGMSVRSLHMALEGTGESFCQLLQRRRLEMSCRLLCREDRASLLRSAAIARGPSAPDMSSRNRRSSSRCAVPI